MYKAPELFFFVPFKPVAFVPDLFRVGNMRAAPLGSGISLPTSSITLTGWGPSTLSKKSFPLF